jgi:hypothetical protein
MSHVVEIKTKLTDLAAIKAACAALGCTFVENQKTYKWFGIHAGDYPLPAGFKAEDMGHCEHAIKVPGTDWEVGVAHARNPDGTPTGSYTLLCDFCGLQGGVIGKTFGCTFAKSSVGAYDGENGRSICVTGMTFHKFLQQYAVAKATIEAKRKGYLVRQQPGKNGAIQVVVTGF